jgi:hypothetical protein
LVVILQLLPPVVLLVGLAVLVDRRPAMAPTLAGALGLLVLAVVQLARHWNDTDEWARSGRWIAAVSVGMAALLYGFDHWSAMVATFFFTLGCMGGSWALFTALRHLCLRSVRSADPADLAASPLALTWPIGSGFRLLAGLDEVGLTKRVPLRHFGSEVRWVDRASWSEVGDVAAVTVSEPGTAPNPRTYASETIRVGRLALRMSVGNRTWLRATRSAERLARLVELRAARHRGSRQAGTHEYDRTGPRP